MCEWRCFDVDRHDEQPATRTPACSRSTSSPTSTPIRRDRKTTLYPNFPVNYLKLDKVPGPDDDWSPILNALRNGDFFVTTGEILIKDYTVDGAGDQADDRRRRRVDVPLAFVEVVWGDGKKVDRQIIPATDLGRVRHQALRDSVRRHRASRGCASRCGIRRATARSSSRSG